MIIRVLFLRHEASNVRSSCLVSKRHFSERLVLKFPTKIQPHLRLIRFDKPIGTYLTLWPGLWGLTLGVAGSNGVIPPIGLTCVFVCGAFLMRSAGCIVNDMWDKDFDSKVSRTSNRPLASGALSTKDGVVALAVCSGLAATTLFALNDYSKVLAICALAPIAMYPAMKRVTWWPQAFLGFTFNWGALLGFAAMRGYLDVPSVCFYLGCAAWTVSYDTIYGHQDKGEDRLLGLKSTALIDEKYGNSIPLISSVVASSLWTVSLVMMYGSYYAIGAALPASLYTIYIAKSTKTSNPEECGKSFRKSQYVGPLMMAGLVSANWIVAFSNSVASMLM